MEHRFVHKPWSAGKHHSTTSVLSESASGSASNSPSKQHYWKVQHVVSEFWTIDYHWKLIYGSSTDRYLRNWFKLEISAAQLERHKMWRQNKLKYAIFMGRFYPKVMWCNFLTKYGVFSRHILCFSNWAADISNLNQLRSYLWMIHI